MMKSPHNHQRLLLLGLACIVLSACGTLPKQNDDSLSKTYLLQAPKVTNLNLPEQFSCVSLMVNNVRAAPGYATPRIAYLQKDHQLSYFAHHQWVDAPANMLTGIVTQTIEDAQIFQAVIQAPAAASTDVRLESELLYLHQIIEGDHSSVHLAIRFTLIDQELRKVMLTHSIALQETVDEQNPYGAVKAANRALGALLSNLLTILSNTAQQYPIKCND